MKSSEAKELADANRLNELEMEKVFSRIRGTARQGKYQTYFVDLRKETKEELKSLGYCVTSCYGRNESNDTVSWYDVEIK